MSDLLQGQAECSHLWKDGWCELCGLGWATWANTEIARLRARVEMRESEMGYHEAKDVIIELTNQRNEILEKVKKAEAVVRAAEAYLKEWDERPLRDALAAYRERA